MRVSSAEPEKPWSRVKLLSTWDFFILLLSISTLLSMNCQIIPIVQIFSIYTIISFFDLCEGITHIGYIIKI